MDISNLAMSYNIEDRRQDGMQQPGRVDVLMSLLRGLFSAPPPPLTRVETWNGDPNMQYGQSRLPQLGSR